MIQQKHSFINTDKAPTWKDTCPLKFIAAPFTIAKIQKQPKCPSTGWLDKVMVYTHTGISLSHKKWDNAISNMDVPRDDHIKWNK